MLLRVISDFWMLRCIIYSMKLPLKISVSKKEEENYFDFFLYFWGFATSSANIILILRKKNWKQHNDTVLYKCLAFNNNLSHNKDDIIRIGYIERGRGVSFVPREIMPRFDSRSRTIFLANHSKTTFIIDYSSNKTTRSDVGILYYIYIYIVL